MSTRHDPKTIALHWLTVALVALSWGSAQLIDTFPRGPSRWNMVGTHMLLGVVMALLMFARIRWRLTRPTVSPARSLGLQQRLATLVHLSLYALVVAAIALGLWNAWVRGEHFFSLFQIPAFDESDKLLRKSAGSLHKLAVNVLLIVAGAHALLALAHHFLWRDDVLRNMWPRRAS